MFRTGILTLNLASHGVQTVASLSQLRNHSTLFILFFRTRDGHRWEQTLYHALIIQTHGLPLTHASTQAEMLKIDANQIRGSLSEMRCLLEQQLQMYQALIHSHLGELAEHLSLQQLTHAARIKLQKKLMRKKKKALRASQETLKVFCCAWVNTSEVYVCQIARWSYFGYKSGSLASVSL